MDSIELQKVNDVYVLLLELQQTLRYRSAFRSEEERAKWWWLAHQLKQQRQKYPEKWDGMADVYLRQVEAAIANLPIAGATLATAAFGDRHHERGSESSASSSAAYELRISVSEIPMLESNSSKVRHQQQRMSGADSEEDTSWANLTRIVRAASERTVRALMGTPNRDNELFLTGNSGGSDARSRSGSSSIDARDSIPTLQRSSSSLSVPNMLRSVVGYLGLSMEETFLCQICFENVSISKSFKLAKCGHRFCEACLQNYLQFKVGEGQVYPTCFHEKEGEPACADEIIPDDIQAVISASFWEKYLKFKFNKEHENARQCPRCDHSQVYLGSEHPECVCDNCGEEFCFVHSIAHRGRSCAEYEKKMVAIEKLNHAMINEISKPCPGCNNFVEKIEIIDDSVFPEHFQWWNIRGCPGNQMAEVEQQPKGQALLMGALRGMFFLVFGPPAFVLAVVFSVLCCCCAPCTKIFDTTYRNAFTTCMCASGYLLLAPFVLALALVCSPCLCCVYWYDPQAFSREDSFDPTFAVGASIQETQVDISPNNESIFRVTM
uniref:RBR-type E3 ubiquitin transferase n=1 Tax=Globisporangium ultimum (strain ATCC 200006 / CBS 805.95 / DAOM BR144) TaxID=431595 RepID=K3WEN6_GLOUD